MKLIHKIFAAAASILALSSCVENAIEDLTGKYEKPVVHEMNTLVSQSVEKGEKTRTFTVEIAGDNAALTMVMVGDKYFLADGSYTPATADQAKKNTYIVGNGGTTFNNIPVETGSIKVTQGEGTYSFAGILWLADESVIELKSTVALVYEADPEPVKLTTVLSATSNLANNVASLTINLATDGVTTEFDMTTYQNVYKGTGNYLALDIYSADGYLHEGTYTANAVGGVLNEGEFGIGYDTTMDFGWGPMEFFNWGTCWWTVTDGATSAEKVLEGTVTVTRKGSKWVIELVSGEGKSMLWTKFEGAIEAVTDPALGGGGNVDDTDYVELTGLISLSKNTGLLTINMATDGVTGTYDPATYSTVYSGTGYYLATDIYSADGKLYTGTYNACAVGGTVGEGEFGIGYDTTMDFGWGPMEFFNWGTCWWTVDDGATSAEKILDGTMEVSVEGANVVIKLKSSVVNAKFTYPIAELLASDGSAVEVVNLGGGDEPVGDYVELTDFLSMTSYLDYGVKMVGVELAASGVSYTFDWTTYQTSYNGEGNYIKLELYSEDGTIAPGTYTACAVGGTVGAGEFGIGYDGQWGASGTTWYTVSGGAATAEYVTDGTVTVEVSGDEYTITLESSLVNAQYVGALAL